MIASQSFEIRASQVLDGEKSQQYGSDLEFSNREIASVYCKIKRLENRSRVSVRGKNIIYSNVKVFMCNITRTLWQKRVPGKSYSV